MNGYQDNSSRKNACRSGMPLMSCPVAGISGNRCINTAPPTCPPEIPCAGSVHPVSENGAFCPQGPEIRPARPYPQTGGNRPPQTFLGGGNYPVGMGYPVNIKTPNPKIAQYIMSQYGGPDGEIGASMRYLSQRYTMPYKMQKGLLTDIGTEELAHMEMIAAIVQQLTRNLTPAQIESSGFGPYYIDHTTAIWPQAAGGIPFNACEFQSKGDAITDLYEDMAADGTTVQEQRSGKPLKIQDFLLYEFFHATFVKGQPT